MSGDPGPGYPVAGPYPPAGIVVGALFTLLIVGYFVFVVALAQSDGFSQP